MANKLQCTVHATMWVMNFSILGKFIKNELVYYTGHRTQCPMPFQPCILLRITRYNDYVMRPRSYSRGLRNRKTYANANASDDDTGKRQFSNTK